MIISEKDVILRERDAFLRGAEWRLGVWQRALRVNYTQGEDEIAESRHLYPLPKVTRLRVVRAENGREFRVFAGQMQTRTSTDMGGEWVCLESGYALVTHGGGVHVTAARVKLWADLLANPTEEVEVDA